MRDTVQTWAYKEQTVFTNETIFISNFKNGGAGEIDLNILYTYLLLIS